MTHKELNQTVCSLLTINAKWKKRVLCNSGHLNVVQVYIPMGFPNKNFSNSWLSDCCTMEK